MHVSLSKLDLAAMSSWWCEASTEFPTPWPAFMCIVDVLIDDYIAAKHLQRPPTLKTYQARWGRSVRDTRNYRTIARYRYDTTPGPLRLVDGEVV